MHREQEMDTFLPLMIMPDIEYVYNDGFKGDLKGTQSWQKSDSPTSSLTLDQGIMA